MARLSLPVGISDVVIACPDDVCFGVTRAGSHKMCCSSTINHSAIHDLPPLFLSPSFLLRHMLSFHPNLSFVTPLAMGLAST